jgi:sortase (surface protein transpeptidase)
MSRQGWLGLLAGCLAALVLIPAGWALARPDASGIGHLPVAASPTAASTANPPASVPDRGAGASAIPVYQADLAAQRGADTRTPTPTILTIASIAVSAPVEAAGVAPDGTVAIPHNAYHVGWYEFGPAPGAATGSAVIVGHRDSRTQGRGALFNLGAVDLGDQIQVRLSDGQTLTYRVVDRRLYLKQGLPWATFFTHQGSPRLTVITCGGAYDPNHGGYQDNLIVTATPT